MWRAGWRWRRVKTPSCGSRNGQQNAVQSDDDSMARAAFQRTRSKETAFDEEISGIPKMLVENSYYIQSEIVG